MPLRPITPQSLSQIQNPKIWFITGTSSGLGYALINHILSTSAGDKVVATSRGRSIHLLKALVAKFNTTYVGDGKERDGKDEENGGDERLRVMELDVTSDEDTVIECAKKAIGVWGRIDVVVNNAGYGPAGTLEESGSSSLLQSYSLNVFGHVKVTNAFLPHFRARKEGTVVFIGSRSSWKTGIPLTGLYCSAKAALHAIVDTYRGELQPFGIRVLGVQPGGFRTNTVRLEKYEKALTSETSEVIHVDQAAGQLSTRTFLPYLLTNPIADYNPQKNFVEKWLVDRAGKEPGDPEKGVEVLVDVVRGEGPSSDLPFPKWLTLGSDCVADIRQKCAEVLAELDAWEEISRSTDFD